MVLVSGGTAIRWIRGDLRRLFRSARNVLIRPKGNIRRGGKGISRNEIPLRCSVLYLADIAVMGWHLIQNKENYMKKKDLILAGAVLLLAGILALALRLPKTENGNTMKVTVDGEVYGTYSLAENQTVKIQTGHGTNVLVIENGSAHMEEADCPDGYCKRQGTISQVNETIVPGA